MRQKRTGAVEVGDRFGQLTVVKKLTAGRSLLRCTCGNSIELYDAQLRSGAYQSCGCRKHERATKTNIIGQRFGRLVVTAELGHGYVMCHCDCGNDKKVRKNQLTQGWVHSCGCLRKEAAPTHGDVKSLSKDGTNLSILATKKPRSNNTSGVRGVHWDKTRAKWVATLKVKGVDRKKRFDTLEQAAEYRKMLEELYVEPLLKKEPVKKDKPPAVPDEELRAAREKACVTRKTVHDRTGLSNVLLQHYENGQQIPPKEVKQMLMSWYSAGCPALPPIGIADDKPDGDYIERLRRWRDEHAGEQEKS